MNPPPTLFEYGYSQTEKRLHAIDAMGRYSARQLATSQLHVTVVIDLQLSVNTSPGHFVPRQSSPVFVSVQRHIHYSSFVTDRQTDSDRLL